MMVGEQQKRREKNIREEERKNAARRAVAALVDAGVPKTVQDAVWRAVIDG